ncbi:hypothetical protein BHM03_00040096 [Ensete ventricosum]|nr:hypothetical protein BHM03_00040096 [Ensete ventricosum]
MLVLVTYDLSYTNMLKSKVCNAEWCRPYWVVRIDPSGDRYTNRPLPSNIVDWGCFRHDFDCCRPLPSGISRGRRKKRKKKRKNLEIQRRSPSTIPIHHHSPNAADEMLPPRLR